MPRIVLPLIVLLFITAPAPAQKTERDRVLKVDAVELIDHQKEIEGAIEFQHQFGRYNYLFANEANMETFKANPTKYEIQQGGACARMGPLSGEGSSKIFTVHEGKLYIFASEQCKRGFLKSPDAVLDRDDPPLTTSAESVARGRELMARAVKGMGGAAKVDAITTYREMLSRETESGGTKYIVTNATMFLMPDAVAATNCWNEQCWSNVLTAGESWTVEPDGSNESMVEAQRTAMLRSAGRHPLSLVRNRDHAKTVIAGIGNTRTVNVPGEGDVRIELFFVHREGATTTLGIDDKDRIVWMSYRGRGPTLAIGTLENVYSGFHDVGGVMLAGRVDVIFDGKPVPDDSGSFALQRVDDDADRALFNRK